MAWTWNEIKDEFLGDGLVANTDDKVVSAFERVERFFGREWMAKDRLWPTGGIDHKGSAITLLVISYGRLLTVLEDGIPGVENLLPRLRDRDQQAWAELRAAYLVIAGVSAIQCEYEPEVEVAGRKKTPDWRFHKLSEPLVCAEVVQPQHSNDYKRSLRVIKDLADLVDRVESSFALEVFLRRDPGDEERRDLEQRIVALARLDGVHEENLPAELGRLFLNQSQPTKIVIEDHGEEPTPRIGVARA